MRVLITGITGNIGQAVIPLSLSQGWQVVGVSRNPYASNYDCELYPLDLCLDVDIARWLSEQDPFDLVVMAHGVQQGCKIGTEDWLDVYHTVIDGNLTSSIYLTQELVKQKKIAFEGAIIYCSSIQATQTRQGRIPYAVAKGGIEALVKGLAVELAPWKVRVVGLRLGQLREGDRPATMAGVVFSPEQLEALKGRALLDWVDTKDIARLCLELYGQKSITGAVLDVDSGHSLSIW